MSEEGLKRIAESGTYTWPWSTPFGLLIITGGSGGGGGGGGAFCIKGLNTYGGAGGKGGIGGKLTRVIIKPMIYMASGGNGGNGGSGGGIINGQPSAGAHGKGCLHGPGSEGGLGGQVTPDAALSIFSNGGNGGRGFPGQTLITDVENLLVGTVLDVVIGEGGPGGMGGDGYKKGSDGDLGPRGHVVMVPIFKKAS